MVFSSSAWPQHPALHPVRHCAPRPPDAPCIATPAQPFATEGTREAGWPGVAAPRDGPARGVPGAQAIRPGPGARRAPAARPAWPPRARSAGRRRARSVLGASRLGLTVTRTSCSAGTRALQTTDWHHQQAEDILRAADDLIMQMANGQLKPKQEEAPTAVADDPPASLTLHCDVNGCTIVPVSSHTPSASGPAGPSTSSFGSLLHRCRMQSLRRQVRTMSTYLTGGGLLAGSFVGTSGQPANGVPRDWHLSEGQGWKLGYDCSPDPSNPTAFTALIGADTWSIALTSAEFADFVKVRQKSCLQRKMVV